MVASWGGSSFSRNASGASGSSAQRSSPWGSCASSWGSDMRLRFLPRFVLLLLATSLAILPACDSYFFYPQRNFMANPHLDRVFHEDVFFEAPDGVRLHGWFLRPNDEPRGTILFFPGNAGNHSTHVGAVLWLAMGGDQGFLIAYRGYRG